MKSLHFQADIELIDIKKNPLNEQQLDILYTLTSSYEALFNKRAQIYKQRDLKSQNLTDLDYRNLLLEHYTFLKRPVLIVDNSIFIGNSAQVIEAAKVFLDER